MRIILVRHGESMANTGEMDPRKVGDHRIPLTRRGRTQANACGTLLGADFLRKAIIYRSPFLRTRETLDGILTGAGLLVDGGKPQVRIFEDPRLREVDTGYWDYDAQEPLRARYGWFYYRFKGGESPADCSDRSSTFLDSMWREVERKQREKLRLKGEDFSLKALALWPYNYVRWLLDADQPDVLIVSHGLAIRCLVMRFLHLTVEQFESMRNPHNCDVITIAPRKTVADPVFATRRWGVTGIRLRKPEAEAPSARELLEP
jgi:broad specificity phosphatase PhoE